MGVDDAQRRGYVECLAAALRTLSTTGREVSFETVYLGGGSPALCDLGPFFDALRPFLSSETELTVELHPLDVTSDLLLQLRQGGVNRISMGVQSLDDAILHDMGRGYSFDEAEQAFALVKQHFDNAGIDLIVGYPNEKPDLSPRYARLAKWGLRHCSVYSLILEETSLLTHRLRRQPELAAALPSDDETLDRLSAVAKRLAEIGLERYEISNYAVPGFACRHNMAVWRGEDYLGLGEGACGRIGLQRTQNSYFGVSALGWKEPIVETVSSEADEKERLLFRLRTREGLDSSTHPEWRKTLDAFVEQNLLTRSGAVYCLTSRGAEVCDSILSEII